MPHFERKLHLRWSDMDPNFHMRHSVYYDFGAQLRMDFLISHGMTPEVMNKHHFGPVLFREEAVFRREIRYGDELVMNVLCTKMRKDYSRFAMRHEIKRGEEVCAVINVEGAFIDTIKRKLTVPPEEGVKMIDSMPKSEDFKWED